jgi:hypothetical protein
VALTLLALIAFASNSLLTRLALGARQIDAATFTAIRLGAGAVVLSLLVRARAGAWTPLRGRGTSGPLALFAYALPFSLAYLRIGAAVGALVLFGVVQLTMIGYGMLRGERPSALTWSGVALATGGLVALTAPSATRPDPLGLVLMAIAGIAQPSIRSSGGVPDPIARPRSFVERPAGDPGHLPWRARAAAAGASGWRSCPAPDLGPRLAPCGIELCRWRRDAGGRRAAQRSGHRGRGAAGSSTNG